MSTTRLFLLLSLALSCATLAVADVTCTTLSIPTLEGDSKSALICYPTTALATAATAALSAAPKAYPLHVFAHGNGGGSVMVHAYTPLLKELASFGFVVAAYESCPIDSHCYNGESQFIEAIKTMRFFVDNPAAVPAAPVNLSLPFSVSGHSTGARAALMLAAAADDPAYLANMSGTAAGIPRLNASDRAILGRIASVVGDHPDPMYVARGGTDTVPVVLYVVMS